MQHNPKPELKGKGRSWTSTAPHSAKVLGLQALALYLWLLLKAWSLGAQQLHPRFLFERKNTPIPKSSPGTQAVSPQPKKPQTRNPQAPQNPQVSPAVPQAPSTTKTAPGSRRGSDLPHGVPKRLKTPRNPKTQGSDISALGGNPNLHGGACSALGLRAQDSGDTGTSERFRNRFIALNVGHPTRDLYNPRPAWQIPDLAQSLTCGLWG